VLFDGNQGENIRDAESSCRPCVGAEGLAAGHGSCFPVMGESECSRDGQGILRTLSMKSK
jgi:hypothetical protein